jgi:hypothetical protein
MIPYTNLNATQLLEMYVAYQLLSAVVQSLDAPTETSNGAYRFIYKFLSLVIADFRSYAQKMPPKPPQEPKP